MLSNRPNKKLTIVGGGIIGAMEAYFAYRDALEKKEQIQVTILEKNHTAAETTTSNIVPSLTPDEILSVVPRGPELVEKLTFRFDHPGGIRVDDVKGVNNSDIADHFKKAVLEYSEDVAGHEARTESLLKLGAFSMQLWEKLYYDADDELKNILREANFKPCREPKNKIRQLHDGYRIDLIFDIPNAISRALSMQTTYQALGFTYCKILTPDEVCLLDPALAGFCSEQSTVSAETQKRVWKDSAVALWRPGGCIDTNTFLPRFYAYLMRKMGTYVGSDGQRRSCFKIRYDKKVTGVIYSAETSHTTINGLRLNNNKKIRRNKYKHTQSDYVFCPGEAVGTLQRLGFREPVFANFAGPSLVVNIPIQQLVDIDLIYINHCMEVHQEGVVLAWQAHIKNGHVFIGVGGTKAFYGDKTPSIDDAFAKNRHLLQLNIINHVLPMYLTSVLGFNTKGKTLTATHLTRLENAGFVRRWVGVRAVAYDGYPTLGMIKTKTNKLVTNARATTHLGSGGVSFAPAAVHVSRMGMFKGNSNHAMTKADQLSATVLQYAASDRYPLTKN